MPLQQRAVESPGSAPLHGQNTQHHGWLTYIQEAPIAEDAEQGVDVALAGEVQACPDMAPRRQDSSRVPGSRAVKAVRGPKAHQQFWEFCHQEGLEANADSQGEKDRRLLERRQSLSPLLCNLVLEVLFRDTRQDERIWGAKI